MHRNAYFFLNPDKKQEQERITFGYKSRHHPLKHTEFEEFEEDVFNIAKSIKFKSAKWQFPQETKIRYTEDKKVN